MKTIIAAALAAALAGPALATDLNVSAGTGIIAGGAKSVSTSGGMTRADGTTAGLDGRGFSSAGALQGASNVSTVTGTLKFKDVGQGGTKAAVDLETFSQSEQFSSIEMIDRGLSTHADGTGVAKSGGVAAGKGGFVAAGFGTNFDW